MDYLLNYIPLQLSGPTTLLGFSAYNPNKEGLYLKLYDSDALEDLGAATHIYIHEDCKTSISKAPLIFEKGIVAVVSTDMKKDLEIPESIKLSIYTTQPNNITSELSPDDNIIAPYFPYYSPPEFVE